MMYQAVFRLFQLFPLLLLLAGLPAPAQVRISEFMAANSTALADDDGDFSDWIEIQNLSTATVNLFDWALTDDRDEPAKWKFPATNLPPGGFLVVFASDKDRRTAGAPLHTNFKLDADGEYLALVDPTGTNVVTEFAPEFPGQVPNVSFGFALTASNVTLVATGATARALVPSAANGGSALNHTWTGHATNEPFNVAGWASGATGVGFGATGVGLNLQASMLNSNASAFVRLAFALSSPTDYSLLTLNLKYNDGFVAWINGVELARAFAPPEDLAWNSSATAVHTNAAFESMVFGIATNLLRAGTNILALQGLNVAATNSSFLVWPELIGTTLAGESASGLYLTQPTPGAANIGGSTVPGPGIASVAHAPNVPLDSDALAVTAKVFPTANPLAAVTMFYRVMYGSETSVTMLDDGTHGDGAAGDGVFGATIPASAATTGEMVRYYLVARDTSGRTSRVPVYTDPAATAQYLGTVVNPDYIGSALPVMQLFIDPLNQSAADSQGGSRCAFYHDGEFYDNIGINLRGNTTGSYTKKSHHLEFNREHKLRHPGPGGRIRHTSLMAEFIDPMYLRHHLSFWLLDQAGHNAPYHYPVRVQNNGQFYQFAYLSETIGAEQLERFGFDPNGALYKAVGTLAVSPCSTGGGPEKKTRLWESGMADYSALAAGIASSLTVAARRTNVFDQLDLPDIINYMACTRLTHEDDDTWANLSIYRDSDGDQLWRIVPFDLNLSWGQTYADTTIQATNDYYRSHPFWGSSPVYTGGACGFNHLFDAIVQIPETREMLQRRVRSVMDQFLQPPGTPDAQSVLVQHIAAMTNLIAAEALLDRQTWNWPPNSGPYNWGWNLWLTNGVNDFLAQYLHPRRQHLFGTHCVTNTAKPIVLATTGNAGFPLSQPADAALAIVAWDYNPASGSQDEEYVQLTNANPFAVDISGWELEGGIHFKFRPGTVIPAHSPVYVSPNPRAFRLRAAGPGGGRGLFVVGPCDGRLNAWGESLALTNAAGAFVCSNGFAGNPSPAQRFLRVTEIMYNPSPFTAVTNDEQQFEYIELKNISTNVPLNLTGVRFTNGIYFNFTGSAVTLLAPQQTVLVVRNPPAFAARYGSGFTIAGSFAGALDNGGETLRLEDAVGEKILEFAYNDGWYPITDGLGFSLVIVDEMASWKTWDQKASWRPSGALNGSPGAPDPAPPAFAGILINEVLTHTDPPQLDSVELFNPTTNAVNLGGWFLTDDFYAPKKYRIPAGTTIAARGYLVFTENQFNTGAGAFRFSEYGESACLFSGDATTNLSGYWHGYEFGEAPNGISFGRYTNSQTNVFFTLQSTVTLGTNNARPRVGPIVISEIMYHPPDFNGADNDLDEFIELQSIAATNVPLYCPGAVTNTWRLRDAVDFDFPTNQSLAAGARLLVVGFNPTNAAQLAAFRAKYGVSNSVPVHGPWQGKLDNSGETLELKQPDTPDLVDGALIQPWIMIDQVHYRDAAPWPALADGVGNSLQRVSNTGYGNDPTNWFAAGVPAGRPATPNLAPAVAITSPTNGAVFEGTDAVIAVSASDSDGSVTLVQLFADGLEIARWTAASSNHLWSGAAGTHVLKARATDNLGAVAESPGIAVTLTAPPPVVALLTPADNAILVAGAIVILSADTSGTAQTVTYYLDGSLIGSAVSPFSLPWTVNPPGGHTLSAIASDSQGQTSAPATISVQVQAASLNPVILPANSIWKYLDNGSNQGTAWTNLTFNDNSWSAGPAELGYGDTSEGRPEATVISYGTNSNSKHITYYFRKAFLVPTLSGITNVELAVMRDDGAIAHLNGREVYRGNLPAGAVTYTNVALTYMNNADEYAYFPTNVAVSALVAGTNILAIEIHQNAVNSSDISFDARLTLQGAWHGPVITNPPGSQSVPAGANVTFTVGSLGTAPLGCRWYFSNAPLPAASAELTLSNVQPANAGPYFVVVTNFIGSTTSSVAILTVTDPDTDGDGMPDAWEAANGTNPSANDASTDLDRDRLSNLQEYWVGTSPTNAASVLRFESVGCAGNRLEFSFLAISNRSYTIQMLTDPGETWEKWVNVSAFHTNRLIWLTNSVDSGTNRFYRLVTPQQP